MWLLWPPRAVPRAAFGTYVVFGTDVRCRIPATGLEWNPKKEVMILVLLTWGLEALTLCAPALALEVPGSRRLCDPPRSHRLARTVHMSSRCSAPGGCWQPVRRVAVRLCVPPRDLSACRACCSDLQALHPPGRTPGQRFVRLTPRQQMRGCSSTRPCAGAGPRGARQRAHWGRRRARVNLLLWYNAWPEQHAPESWERRFIFLGRWLCCQAAPSARPTLP